MITKEIKKLDNFINKRLGSDCGTIYSVHYGFENPIIKRIEYMKKINYTAEQIEEYKQANRRFFVIRELEISEAIKNNDYDTAIKVLLESKELDAGNTEQLEKYCGQLIKIYSAYLKQAAEMANERKKYKYLMPYLKKISKCDGRKAVAEDIAATWRREYKRRTAMMDELRKAGF